MPEGFSHHILLFRGGHVIGFLYVCLSSFLVEDFLFYLKKGITASYRKNPKAHKNEPTKYRYGELPRNYKQKRLFRICGYICYRRKIRLIEGNAKCRHLKIIDL